MKPNPMSKHTQAVIERFRDWLNNRVELKGASGRPMRSITGRYLYSLKNGDNPPRYLDEAIEEYIREAEQRGAEKAYKQASSIISKCTDSQDLLGATYQELRVIDRFKKALANLRKDTNE